MKIINISEETWEKIKDQVNEEEIKPVTELNDLIGKKYAFWCARYIYFGEIKAVNSTWITLKKAGVVYDTGELKATAPTDIQEYPKDLNIMWSAVESFNTTNW